jgi:hypothetical protein
MHDSFVCIHLALVRFPLLRLIVIVGLNLTWLVGGGVSLNISRFVASNNCFFCTNGVAIGDARVETNLAKTPAGVQGFDIQTPFFF